MATRTLNEELRQRGLTTRPNAVAGTKDVIRDGVVVLEAVRAREVWAWLRRQEAAS